MHLEILNSAVNYCKNTAIYSRVSFDLEFSNFEKKLHLFLNHKNDCFSLLKNLIGKWFSVVEARAIQALIRFILL